MAVWAITKIGRYAQVSCAHFDPSKWKNHKSPLKPIFTTIFSNQEKLEDGDSNSAYYHDSKSDEINVETRFLDT